MLTPPRHAVLALFIFAGGSSLQGQGSFGALAGRVTAAEGGAPVAGAVVSIVGTELSVRTDSTGRYFMRSVPTGPQTVRVRRVGFQGADQQAVIVENAAAMADVRMTGALANLDTVRVKGENWLHKPARLMNTTKYDEFYERKVISAGGYQFTHEDLEKRVNTNLAETFSSVPGVRIGRVGSRYGIALPNCPQTNMAVFVDNVKVYPSGTERVPSNGMFYNPGRAVTPPSGNGDGPLDVLASMDLNTVEAIELYKSISGMPAIARGDNCAALFIWTR